MGCHFLLQGIFLAQGLNLGLLHCRQTLSRLSHQGWPDCPHFTDGDLSEWPAAVKAVGWIEAWSRLPLVMLRSLWSEIPHYRCQGNIWSGIQGDKSARRSPPCDLFFSEVPRIFFSPLLSKCSPAVFPPEVISLSTG